jgi:hypothetical protein
MSEISLSVAKNSRQEIQLKLLDLCCGMGGWSVGFHRHGFDCDGVDIVDVGYPYNLILEDLRDYHPKPSHYDVIVASPPCTEFSELLFLAVAKGQRGPGDINKAMELVKECIRVIDEAKPEFWVLENVKGSVKHIATLLGQPKISFKPWYLWGKLPTFMFPTSYLGTKGIRKGPDNRLNSDVKWDPSVSWKRAKIPVPLSVTIARACREALTEKSEVFFAT